MLFNSIDFAVFLPVVFALYWALKPAGIGWQNLLLVAASYLFYGWWDWRFLGLILISTLVDYSVGRSFAVQEHPGWRKALLWTSLVVNLGMLGVFKYFNFFVESATAAFSFLGTGIDARALHIVLPVGISFYTFQTLSYTIDVYRRKIEPTRDFVGFAAFVSFFPQLVAGPIERATRLLPQFFRKREFDYKAATDGLSQMVWGLFKKLVIADNCAVYVDMIFDHPEQYSGSTLVLGGVLFAFQIYGDFSGYSDIAIGTAKLFGFHLMTNFAFPYFSRDVAEFWRRWHISLSTWFRDYVYIPLGGNRGKAWKRIRNVMIVFVVSGLWHGANWTFVAWGFLNALYFLPLLLARKNRDHMEIVAADRFLPGVREAMMMLMTFGLTVLAWVFFRAESIGAAFAYLGHMFSLSLFSLPEIRPKTLLVLLTLFIGVEWIGRRGAYGTEWVARLCPSLLRGAALYVLIIGVVVFMADGEQEFIYFQF